MRRVMELGGSHPVWAMLQLATAAPGLPCGIAERMCCQTVMAAVVHHRGWTATCQCSLSAAVLQDASFVYPDQLASPQQILVDASNGASDYGNKFGEPVVAGYTRTFGMRLPSGERWEWIKPIMFRYKQLNMTLPYGGLQLWLRTGGIRLQRWSHEAGCPLVAAVLAWGRSTTSTWTRSRRRWACLSSRLVARPIA